MAKHTHDDWQAGPLHRTSDMSDIHDNRDVGLDRICSCMNNSHELTTLKRLVYTISEVAELLGVCRAQVYRLLQANRLRSITIGRRGQRITAVELQRFLEDQDRDRRPRK